MRVFVVGKCIGETWEMQGVFDTARKAEQLCVGHTDFFVGPLTMNEALPYETMKEWPGVYSPEGVIEP